MNTKLGFPSNGEFLTRPISASRSIAAQPLILLLMASTIVAQDVGPALPPPLSTSISEKARDKDPERWSVPIRQPDGTELKLLFSGTPEYPWYETEDGFTVVRRADNTYVYARRDKSGDLVPIDSLVVGRDQPARNGVSPGVRPTPEALERVRLERQPATQVQRAASPSKRVYVFDPKSEWGAVKWPPGSRALAKRSEVPFNTFGDFLIADPARSSVVEAAGLPATAPMTSEKKPVKVAVPVGPVVESRIIEGGSKPESSSSDQGSFRVPTSALGSSVSPR